MGNKGGESMVGIKDIAKAAGVSPSTVSNVLNGKKNVGEDTRKKILTLAEEMHYVPNVAGKLLKTRENKTILFVFSDFDRSFYLNVLKGINDYLKDKEYDLLICTQRSCEKFMRNNMTSGCIILDASLDDSVVARCANEHYPIVVLDRIIDSDYVKSVIVDNYHAMCDLVQDLIDREYRRFAFVGGLESTVDNQERYRAFRDTLKKNNIHFPQKNYFSGDYREKSGYTAAKILALTDIPPEVLVCANDNMAIGAIKAFREDNIRVPEDIAVTGFDDNEYAHEIGLTTVTVPDYERGYLAALYLVETLKGKETAGVFRISAKIKNRKSVLVKRNKKQVNR